MSDTRTTEDTDDLRHAISEGIYGDDRMTRKVLDEAFAALDTLTARIRKAEAERDWLAEQLRDYVGANTLHWLKSAEEATRNE